LLQGKHRSLRAVIGVNVVDDNDHDNKLIVMSIFVDKSLKFKKETISYVYSA